MTITADRVAAPRNVALLLSALVAVLGASVLAGWALDIVLLKSIWPGAVTMTANTAIVMLLYGIALARLSARVVGHETRRFAMVVACGGIAIGALCLGESLFGWDVGIDQWLFQEAPGALESTRPGQVPPPAAFCFLLSGIALFFQSRAFARQVRLPILLALSVTVIVIGGLAMLGHLLLALFHIRFWNYAGLAIHTATGLLLLGCAQLAWVRNERGFTWSMDGMTTGGFVVGIVILIVASGISYSFTDQLRRDARWVSHTEEVLKEIQTVAASQKDLTLTLGRYLITGDEGAIAQRASIRASVQYGADRIRRLTVDNPGQQVRIDRFGELTGQRMAMADQIIAQARRKAVSEAATPTLSSTALSAAAAVTSPLGLAYPQIGMDIDALLKAMEAEEVGLLQQRLVLSEISSTRTFLLMPVGVYLSLTMLLLGLFHLNSGTAERSRSEKEVVRLNAQLESRVRERTGQLEASNADLASARKEADRANRAKSEFLSSMSHELRTPLNAILGFGQILASDTLLSTPAQKKAFNNHIVKAGRHLLTLVDEILDLAQIESGKTSLSLETFALAELFLECQAMTEPLGNQCGIQMTFPNTCGLHVEADRTRLKQVLLNLLSNAIKYNRENGQVVVDAAQASPDRIRISVQNTGEGVYPEQLRALFQSFNRLGQEKGGEEGTGIGLVLTKRLIELMGGEIGVDSTIGVGTRFWIELRSALPGRTAAGDNSRIALSLG